MEEQGWIKDYRKEMDSDIWVMPPLYYKVWQYLKYMANHKKNVIPMHDGSKEIIEVGQHLTSYRAIAKGVAYYENRVLKEPNAKTIKKILEWLEKNNMILLDHGTGNRQYTKITIVNYRVYQTKDNEQVTEKKQLGNSEETVGKQSVDINKNEKNDKERYKNEKERKEGEKVTPTTPHSLNLDKLDEVHKLIASNVTENTYLTWFDCCEIVDEGNKIIITTPNKFTADCINEKFVRQVSLLTGREIVVKEG